jgi:hypothetical protein
MRITLLKARLIMQQLDVVMWISPSSMKRFASRLDYFCVLSSLSSVLRSIFHFCFSVLTQTQHASHQSTIAFINSNIAWFQH